VKGRGKEGLKEGGEVFGESRRKQGGTGATRPVETQIVDNGQKERASGGTSAARRQAQEQMDKKSGKRGSGEINMGTQGTRAARNEEVRERSQGGEVKVMIIRKMGGNVAERGTKESKPGSRGVKGDLVLE